MKHKNESNWNKEVLDAPVTTAEKDKTSNVSLIPAKLICFVCDQNGGMYAIIQSCLENCAKMSVLTYRWQLEYLNDEPVGSRFKHHSCSADASALTPVYQAVSVDTIQKHCLMIPYCGKNISCFLMQVVDQNNWWELFSNV